MLVRYAVVTIRSFSVRDVLDHGGVPRAPEVSELMTSILARLRDKALSATRRDDPDIAMATVSGLRTRPMNGYNTPAAMGNAMMLQPCAHQRFSRIFRLRRSVENFINYRLN